LLDNAERPLVTTYSLNGGTAITLTLTDNQGIRRTGIPDLQDDKKLRQKQYYVFMYKKPCRENVPAGF